MRVLLLLAASVAFAQSDAPPAPTLLSPPDNAELHNFPRDLMFQWTPVSGAESYTLQIDCDQCCGKGFCSEISPDRISTFRDLQSTRFRYEWYGDQRARWRVWANKGFLESPKTEWRIFDFRTGVAPTPPAAPKPVFPLASTLPAGIPEVEFEWSPVAGAGTYVLELDRLHTCMNGRWCSDVGVYNLTENIQGTRQTLPVPGGSYLRWRVWAVAADRRSQRSEWIMFNTLPGAASPPPRVAPSAAPSLPQPTIPTPSQGQRTGISSRVDPDYSPEARAAGLEGTVTVGYEIDTAGVPRGVSVIQGLGLGLDEKAVEAVSKWRFAPSGGTRSEASEVGFSLGGAGWRVRHTAYTVIRRSRQAEVTAKPVLTHYVLPSAAACPSGQRTLVEVSFHVDRKGTPSDIRLRPAVAGMAIRPSVEAWSFHPASADGDPREAEAAFTLECNGGSPEPAPVLPGGRTTPPVLLSKVEPEYSETARKMKLQGGVVLLVVVDQDGFVTNISVKQGLERGLDRNAMEAVRQWRFKPAERAGLPVPFSASIEVSFRLL